MEKTIDYGDGFLVVGSELFKNGKMASTDEALEFGSRRRTGRVVPLKLNHVVVEEMTQGKSRNVGGHLLKWQNDAKELQRTAAEQRAELEISDPLGLKTFDRDRQARIDKHMKKDAQ